MTTKEGRPSGFHRSYEGHACFLLLGGPSTKGEDLSLLNQRGVVTMAVNNAWLIHRPNFWVAVDPPGRFHISGWRDPGITKFVPRASLSGKLREEVNGEILETPLTPREMPAVYTFTRDTDFNPKTFFETDGCQWGADKEKPDALNIKNTRSVMLVALRLLEWMGFHDVYLLGCDFKMEESRPYAFDEVKNVKGIAANNRAYRVMSMRLAALQSQILASQRPFRLHNCNPHSHLRTFPHVSLARGVGECARRNGERAIQRGWYT